MLWKPTGARVQFRKTTKSTWARATVGGEFKKKSCNYTGHNQNSKYINQTALGYSDTSPLISISSSKLSSWGTDGGAMTHLQYVKQDFHHSRNHILLFIQGKTECCNGYMLPLNVLDYLFCSWDIKIISSESYQCLSWQTVRICQNVGTPEKEVVFIFFCLVWRNWSQLIQYSKWTFIHIHAAPWNLAAYFSELQ